MKLGNKGFTILEALVVTAVVAVLAAVCITLLTNVKDNVADQKLKKDVSSLNSAVRVYMANGGDLTGITDPRMVLAKLKRVAAADTSMRVVGLKGSALDVRMVLEEQTAAEAASDQLRAYWDDDLLKFTVDTSGPRGIARFRIDDNAAVSGGSETRRTKLQYAKDGRWVWDYTDRSAGGGSAPSDIPGGPGTPPGITLTGAPPAKALLAPIIEQPGGDHSLFDYPMVVSVSDPNTASATGISQLMYSVDSVAWTLYTGPVTVNPGDRLEAIAITIDPDNWTDSPLENETYTAIKVTPELEVALPTSVNYFQLGGEAMGDTVTYAKVQPGRVNLLNGDDIPDGYESSALFQVYWTSDDSDPLTSATRTGGVGFSNGFVTQEIPIDLDGWPEGEVSLPIKVAAQAIDREVFNDSPQHGTRIAGEVLDLRAPIITVDGDLVYMDFVTTYGDMPEGARIYYTTDGTVPAVGAGNTPISGTPYSGAFLLEGDAVITARVFGPDGQGHWFNPSPDSVEDFTSPFTREVFIGGRFAKEDGSYRNVARLSPVGAIDPSFNPGLGASYGSTVGVILPQAGGQILAGGDFDSMNKTHRYGVVRLNNDGSVDPSFDAKLE